VEIVGINYGGQGRTCGLHSTNCGVQIAPGMNLMVRKITEQVTVDVRETFAISEPALDPSLPKKRGRKRKPRTETRLVSKTIHRSLFKTYIWDVGVEGCCVGMIGRPFIFLYEDALDGRVIKVTELTANSEIESAKESEMMSMGA
jgi:hypothetical protein